MLKLYKHYFKSLSKIHIIFISVMFVNAITYFLLNKINISNSEFGKFLIIIKNFSLNISIISFLLLPIMTFFYIVMFYRRKMFSDEGYLTNTLPLKKHTLINIFFLLALTFFAIDLVVVILTSFLVNADFLRLGKVTIEIESILGFSLVLMVVFAALSQFFLAISIGYSSSKNKVKATIIAGVVIYLVNQSLGGIILGISFAVLTTLDSSTSLSVLLLIINLFYLCLFIVSYTLINRFVTKSLNLD